MQKPTMKPETPDAAVSWIGWLIVVGIGYVTLGGVLTILGAGTKKWGDIGIGAGIIWLGVVTMALGGIWGTLERIARKP